MSTLALGKYDCQQAGKEPHVKRFIKELDILRGSNWTFVSRDAPFVCFLQHQHPPCSSRGHQATASIFPAACKVLLGNGQGQLGLSLSKASHWPSESGKDVQIC